MIKGVTRDKLSDQQVIVEYLEGRRKDTELTEHQVKYFDTVKAIYDMMLKAKSKARILKEIQVLADCTRRHAYQLYQEAEYIWGNTSKSNKEVKRHMAEEMAKKAYRIAVTNKDVNAMIKATHAFIRATGVESEDPDMPDFSRLQPSVIVTILPPELERNIMEQLKAGYMDFSKSFEVEDVPHEEVTD